MNSEFLSAAELFAGNTSINDEIAEILSSFPEPSCSRMLKKIRQDRDAFTRLGSSQADENARHTFREFLVARMLNSLGYSLEYNRPIEAKTPDWHDEKNKLLLEVFTCERGGSSDPVDRMATRIREKTEKYEQIAERFSLRFLVAIHGDFLAALFDFHCEEAIRNHRIFESYQNLSGVFFFGESRSVILPVSGGKPIERQLYRYTYFENTNAVRKFTFDKETETF